MAWAERFEFSDEVIVPYLRQKLAAFDLDAYGAIVLGCGGMAGFAADMQAALGIPVIDGVSAAVKLAEAAVGLGLHTSKPGPTRPCR